MLLSDSYRYKIPVYNRYGEYHCCGTRYRYHSIPLREYAAPAGGCAPPRGAVGWLLLVASPAAAGRHPASGRPTPTSGRSGGGVRWLATRWRPLAEYGRGTVRKAEATERPAPRSRATWNRASLTLAELPAAVDRARSRLRPDVAERLDQLGRERALLYKLLVLTGLRRGEAASLTIASVDLDGRVPCIRLRAADAKSGQAAELPLRADLAADLRSWFSERLAAARAAARAKQLPLPARLPDDAKLFNVPPNLSAIFNRDLRLAGIPKRDDRGRTVDVHALRHTFASLLSRGGVAPRTAQAALRHSTIELTMQTYTDPRLLDVAGALDVLPDLPLDGRPDAERMRATGTDDAANRTDASAGSLVPNLVLAIDRDRARLAQTDQVNKIGDLSAVLGSDAAVTSCAKGAENSTKPPAGFEPATCGLQNRCSAD